MRTEWTFVAGLAVGAVGAFAALSAGRTQPAPPPAPDVARPDPGAETVGTGPTLRVAPPVPEPSVPAPGTPAGAAVVAVDLRDFAEVVQAAPEAEREHLQVAAMLARGYARAGRPEALRRVLSATLAAGISIDACLGLFSFLPEDRQASALAAFLAEHPAETPSAAALAWAWIRARVGAKAFGPATERLKAVQGNDPALTQALFALDAERADALVWRLATEQDWGVPALAGVPQALVVANRADLLPRWQERLARAQGAQVAANAPTVVDLAQQVATAEVAARETPEDADRWVDVARAREEAGDHKGAIQAWRAAIERAGPEADMLRDFVRVDAAAAFPTVEAIARDAHEDDVLLLYVEACLRVGKPEEAGAAFFRRHTMDDVGEWFRSGIAALAPGPALARTERMLSSRGRREDAEVRFARADALAAMGRTDVAAAEFLALDSPIGDPARDALLRADPARAAAHFESLRAGPDGDDSDDLASRLALARWRSGRPDAAKALAEPIVARAESGGEVDEDALSRLAPVFPDRVLAFLAKEEKEGKRGHRPRALALAALGRTAEARALLDACLKDGEDGPALLIARGLCR